jgi:hypothetical protein
LAPVIEKLLIINRLVVLLVKVTVWGLLVTPTLSEPKPTADGFTPISIPVPVNETVSGEWSESLLLMEMEADRAPVAVGANFTLIVQLPPIATLPPQLLVTTKSPALVPVARMLLTVKGAVPVLDNVVVMAPLVVPTTWLPKANVVGATPAMGAVPVPVNDTFKVG